MSWTSSERLMYVPFTSCVYGKAVYCFCKKVVPEVLDRHKHASTIIKSKQQKHDKLFGVFITETKVLCTN